MPLARSKLTARGQISVPASIRQKLGVTAGSILEWDEEDGKIVVRRAARYTSEDLHRAAFPEGPPKRATLKELKQGIRDYVRERHARGRY
jgi:antitoxin PrlF